jgi:4-hydroxybenzoate polyprenyltransferase
LNLLFVGSVLSVAFIVLANTILCDIPDFEADRQSGVRGITPRFGPRAGAISAIVCSCLGTIIAAFVGCWVLALTSLAMGVLAVIAFKDSEQYNFRLLADLVVTVLPGPLTLLFQ